jgi:hypothetical protein
MDATALDEDDPDLRALRLDSDRASPLARVHFAEGMLLGIEATNAEQEFHRRRLVRHQHWLHGSGTIVGLAVSLEQHELNPPDVPGKQIRLDVHVAPGVAVDGLGREVQCAESYCIDLVEWLVAQGDDPKAGAFGVDGIFRLDDWLMPAAPGLAKVLKSGVLNLRVTARQEACPRGLQPVFAHRLNDSTDAVDASRIGDGVELELLPDETPSEDFRGRPRRWADVDVPGDGSLDPLLTAAETAHLAGLSASDRNAMRRRARLLYAAGAGLPSGGGAGTLPATLAATARTLLARISIPVPDPASVVLDPAAILVDNLVRPFAVADELLPPA